MQALIIGFWVIQGILAAIDEFKFHHQRGLNTWERVGHPVDSLFFLMPFVYTQFFSNIFVFIGLCILSSLIITKDEFIHSRECCGAEQLLHALLFVLHPVALYVLWLAWNYGFNSIIQLQALAIFLFMLYQIVYWNFIKGKNSET